ncbi:MAG: DUF418 domain-containing protein [Gammaproteobacteria bacterium]|nr:MAG: DUF418 domain-containing protein [Gammaproteobacteria bacterium]
MTVAPPGDRIASLDVLRGFAVLGILIINIQAFALPESAFSNPLAAGGFAGPDYWIWIAGHLFAEQKFISIFSMLFGAGIVIFTARAGPKATRLHYRRMLWLLLFGLIHACLLWYGDILMLYAVCGGIVVWMRGWRTRTLLIAATALLLLTATLTGLMGATLREMHNALVEFDRRAAVTVPAPDANAELLMGMSAVEVRARLDESRELWQPPAARIEEETAAFTGSYSDELRHRIPLVLALQGYTLAIYSWRTLGLMLLGMVLLRSGILGAGWSTRVHASLAVGGFALGLPVVWIGLDRNLHSGFDWIEAQTVNWLFNYFGSIAVALGWIGLIMLLCRSEALAKLKLRMAAVGRMAFSNYILHTLVCTTIFYGRGGLGLAQFNQWDRVQLLLLVLAIYALQLWLSPLWLRHHQRGPLEWLWRRLTSPGN